MDTAICKYCGNGVLVEVSEGMSDAERADLGALHCTCAEAVKYQNRIAAAESTKLKLEDLLLKDDTTHNIKAVSEDVVDMLKKAIDLMVQLEILKVTVKAAGSCTVDITMNAQTDKFTVQRSFVAKQKREVE